MAFDTGGHIDEVEVILLKGDTGKKTDILVVLLLQKPDFISASVSVLTHSKSIFRNVQ